MFKFFVDCSRLMKTVKMFCACFSLFWVVLGCFGLFKLLRLCKLFSVVSSSFCSDVLLDALDSSGCVRFCRWL